MAPGEEVGSAADEIDAGGTGIGDAAMQQRRLQSATPEGWVGGGVGAIAHLVRDVEDGGRCRLAVEPRQVERPAWLAEPAPRTLALKAGTSAMLQPAACVARN